LAVDEGEAVVVVLVEFVAPAMAVPARPAAAVAARTDRVVRDRPGMKGSWARGRCRPGVGLVTPSASGLG
jgi:hypothetical protein